MEITNQQTDPLESVTQTDPLESQQTDPLEHPSLTKEQVLHLQASPEYQGAIPAQEVGLISPATWSPVEIPKPLQADTVSPVSIIQPKETPKKTETIISSGTPTEKLTSELTPGENSPLMQEILSQNRQSLEEQKNQEALNKQYEIAPTDPLEGMSGEGLKMIASGVYDAIGIPKDNDIRQFVEEVAKREGNFAQTITEGELLGSIFRAMGGSISAAKTFMKYVTPEEVWDEVNNFKTQISDTGLVDPITGKVLQQPIGPQPLYLLNPGQVNDIGEVSREVEPKSLWELTQDAVQNMMKQKQDAVAQSAVQLTKLRGPLEAEFGGLSYKRLGELDFGVAKSEQINAFQVLQEQLHEAWKSMEVLPSDTKLEFLKSMEEGTPIADKGMAELGVRLNALLDDYWKTANKLAPDVMNKYIENYFPHIWEDPDAAANWYQQFLAKNPLQGKAAFTKQRFWQTIEEAMRPIEEGGGGLKLYTENPVELTLLRLKQMGQFNMAHGLINKWLDNGLAQLVDIGGIPLTKDGQALEGWRPLKDSIADIVKKVTPYTTDALGFSTDTGQSSLALAEGTPIKAITQKVWLPNEIANLVEANLSPGLTGNKAFDAFRSISNLQTAMQLGLSGFHATFIAGQAAASSVALGIQKAMLGIESGNLAMMSRGLGNITEGAIAPISAWNTFWRGNSIINEDIWMNGGPEFRQMVTNALEGGQRIIRDDFYKNSAAGNFSKLLQDGKYAKGTMLGLNRAINLTNKIMLDEYVPRMKMGAFAQLAQFEIEKLGPSATKYQIMDTLRKVSDTIDNRFGQLVYDNLFWSNQTKALLMTAFRSFGWNYGTVREIGGGVLDLMRTREVTPQAAYLPAIWFTTGLQGGLLHWAMTGNAPETLTDMFYPKNASGIRMNMPWYGKDIVSLVHDPLKTFYYKLNPTFTTLDALAKNKDYMDLDIRRGGNFWTVPLETKEEQLRQAIEYMFQGFEPFAISQALLAAKKAPNTIDAVKDVTGAFLGATEAPSWIQNPEKSDLFEFKRQQLEQRRERIHDRKALSF